MTPKPISGLDPARSFPYYKLQYYDTKLSVWIDIQKSFGSIEELHDYAASELEPNTQVRIVIVEEYGKRRVLERP